MASDVNISYHMTMLDGSSHQPVCFSRQLEGISSTREQKMSRRLTAWVDLEKKKKKKSAIYLRMMKKKGRNSVRGGIPTLYIPKHFLITAKPLPGPTQRHALVSIHPLQSSYDDTRVLTSSSVPAKPYLPNDPIRLEAEIWLSKKKWHLHDSQEDGTQRKSPDEQEAMEKEASHPLPWMGLTSPGIS